MNHLDLKKPVLVGYDWGAGIALYMAINNQFEAVIAFMPACGENLEFKQIKSPVMI